MTNLICYDRPKGDLKWNGFVMYKVFADRNGESFPDRCARYVAFYNGVLVAEKHHDRDAEKAFENGDRDHSCRLEDYKGVTNK